MLYNFNKFCTRKGTSLYGYPDEYTSNKSTLIRFHKLNNKLQQVQYIFNQHNTQNNHLLCYFLFLFTNIHLQLIVYPTASIYSIIASKQDCTHINIPNASPNNLL